LRIGDESAGCEAESISFEQRERENASPVKATFTSGFDKCGNIEETTKIARFRERASFSISSSNELVAIAPKRIDPTAAGPPRTIDKKKKEKEKGKDNDEIDT